MAAIRASDVPGGTKVRRWLGFDRAHSTAIAAAAILLGVLLRVIWNYLRPNLGTVGEVVNIASALASGHGYSDAYAVGQGPTAHLMPTMPLLVGAVYALLGVRTMAAETVLATWSIGLTMARFILFNHLFRQLGVAERPRLIAFVLLCCIPIFISQEAVDFRVWEGGLASFVLVLLLLVTVGGEQRGKPRVVLLAVTAATLFFVNPMVGLASYAAVGLLWLRQLGVAGTFRAGALAAAVLTLLLAPWAIRNARAMGTPILLRSNAGLELSIAMNPAMLTTTDLGKTYRMRMSIHPAANRVAYNRMQAEGGEVAYSRWLGKVSLDWMRGHPSETAALIALHLRQAIMPQTWMFSLFSNPILAMPRALIVSAINVIGIFALGYFTICGSRGWQYLALTYSLFIMLCALFQPIPRYINVTFPLLAFAAVALIHLVFTGLSRARQVGGRIPAAGWVR